VPRIWIWSLLVSGATLGAHSTQAQATEDASSGVHTHDGFLARISIGPALGLLSESAQIAEVRAGRSTLRDAQLDVAGGGYAFALDAGYALGPSFALHARLSQFVLPDPALEGESPDGFGDPARTLALFAPALSWFGPFGLYVVVASGLAFVRVQRYDGDAGWGDIGLGANLDVGVEFWIAEQFAFGVVLRGHVSTTGGSTPAERTQRALALTLALSLTYQ
jgi:hypothetical protein